ncbi:cation channel sperm-associated protein 3-like isoform X2 [Narcine bancroftii]|uniref:cation channel sperm-associated protein 3-like isoform X2 n=1 Tax=Narcine bancroftii TaxID=1343680 RepID=UPI0038311C0C
MVSGSTIHPSAMGLTIDKKIFDDGLSRKRRRDFAFQNYVKRLLKTRIFKLFIFTAILANSLLLAFETDHAVEYDFFVFFNVAEQLFLSIYTVEFLAKIYVDPIRYWKNGFNVFDFIVLMLSYIQRIFILKDMDDMTWFHVVRPLRILRAISLVRGLQVLFDALVRTLKNVAYVLFLLFLLMTMFALIGYNFYGDSKDGDFDNWGSLKSAYFSLFSIVTLDSWSDLQAETGAFGFYSSQFFIMVFILLGFFLFINLFIGVMIINIRETTREFNKGIQAERETTLMEKKQAILHRQQTHITQIMEKQKTSQFESFNEIIEKFKQTLRHDDFVMLDDLCSSLSFIDIYLSSLDEQDNTLYNRPITRIEIPRRKWINLL